MRGVGEVFLLERVQTCFLCGLRPLLVDTLSRRRPLSLAGARLQVCTHQRIAKQQRFGVQISCIARSFHFALQNERRLHNHLCTVLFSTFHHLTPSRKQKHPLLHTYFYFPPEAEVCIFAHTPFPHQPARSAVNRISKVTSPHQADTNFYQHPNQKRSTVQTPLHQSPSFSFHRARRISFSPAGRKRNGGRIPAP